MDFEEKKRRAEAAFRWGAAHDAGESECPVCRGIKWAWQFETTGPLIPRVCIRCGHVQWFMAVAVGIEPAPAPAAAPEAPAEPPAEARGNER
jgi:hypothetical protein